MLYTTAPQKTPLYPSSRLTQLSQPAQHQLRKAQDRLSKAQHKPSTAQRKLRTAQPRVRKAWHNLGTAQQKVSRTQHKPSMAQQQHPSSDLVTVQQHKGKPAVLSRLTGLLKEWTTVTPMQYLLVKLDVVKICMLPCMVPKGSML